MLLRRPPLHKRQEPLPSTVVFALWAIVVLLTACDDEPMMVFFRQAAAQTSSSCSAVSPYNAATATPGKYELDAKSTTSLECTFSFSCPTEGSTVDAILLEINGGASKLTVSDAFKTFTYFGSDAPVGMHAYGNGTLDFKFEVKVANSRLRWSYTCIENQYSVVGCPRTDTLPMPITYYPTMIGTDLDGERSRVKANSNGCTWLLQCPTGMVIEIESFSQDMLSDGYVRFETVSQTLDDDGNTVYSYNRNGHQINSFTLNDGPVQLSNFVRVTTYTQRDVNGFSMNYTCVAPPNGEDSVFFGCDPNGRELTGFPGSFGSDIDGNGGFDRGASTCLYTVRCPLEHVVYIERFQLDAKSADDFRFYELNDAGDDPPRPDRIAAFETTKDIRDKPISRFINVYSYTKSTSNGFRIDYTCKKLNQHFGCPTLVNRTLARGESFKIGSDIDGRGSVTYHANNFCKWYIACENSHDVVYARSVRAAVKSDDRIRLANTLHAINTTTWWGASANLQDGYPFGNEMLVTFISNDKYGEDGFEMDLVCVPGNVTMGCPKDAMMVGRDAGMIGTDLDGYGPWQYGVNENCQWNISCAHVSPDAVVALTQLRLKKKDDDKLVMYDLSSTNEGPVIATVSQHSAFKYEAGTVSDATDTKFLPIAPTVQFNFVTNDKYNEQGFDLNFTCVDSPTKLYHFGCPSNDTIFNKHNEGTIGSDIDGAGTFMLAHNLKCFWNVQCPNPGDSIHVRKFSRKMSSDDYVRFYSAPFKSFPGMTSGSRNSGAFYKESLEEWPVANALTVYLATNDKYASQGFHIDYICRPLNSYVGCPVDLVKQKDVPTTITGYPGYLGSDIDGVEDGALVDHNARCGWNITCPAGMVVEVRRIRMSLSSGDRLSTYSSDMIDDGLTLTSELAGNTYASDKSFRVARSLAIRLSTNDAYFSKGFDLNYTCVPHSRQPGSPFTYFGCPTSAILTEYPGSFGSDIDGYGEIPYANNQVCKWSIQCPANKYVVFTRLKSKTKDSDRVKFGSATGHYAYYAGEFTTTTYEPVAPHIPIANVVKMQFTSNGAYVNNGFEIDYDCVDGLGYDYHLGCPYANHSIVPLITSATGGMIGTDLDGAGPAFRVMSSRSCLWKVRCPVHAVAVVDEMVHDPANGAELTFYTVMTVPGNPAVNNERRKSGVSISGQTIPKGQILSQSFDVTYTTPSSVESTKGFHLKYSCQKKAFGFFGCSKNATVSYFPGKIGSDFDGLGDHGRFALGTCYYHLKCPAGGQVQVKKVHLSTSSDAGELNFFKHHPTLSEVSPNEPLLAQSWVESKDVEGADVPANLVVSGVEELYVRFLGKTDRRTGGFELEFDCDCSGSRCPLPEIPATPSVSLTPSQTWYDHKGARTPTNTVEKTSSATLLAPPKTQTVIETPPPLVPPPPPRKSGTHSATTEFLEPPVTEATPTTTVALSPPLTTLPPTSPPPTPEPTEAPTPIPTPPPPPKPKPKPTEVQAVQATTQATTMAAGVANPAVAAQTARASVVLSLQQCAYDLDEDLDWSTSPTGLSLISSDATRLFIGAILGNTMIVLGAIGVHFLVAMYFVKANKSNTTELLLSTRMTRALANMRFPSGSMMILAMFLLQPSVSSAVTVARHSTTAGGVAIGSIFMLALVVAVGVSASWFRKHFHSHWVDQAGETMHRSNFKAFMNGTGKWSDNINGHLERKGFTRMFGAFYNDFGGGCAWFGLMEIVVCILCGILEGWKTNIDWHCKALVGSLIFLNVVYVALIVYFRPHGTQYDFWMFFFIAALQLGSSTMAAIDAIPNNQDIAEHCAVASMLLATLKGTIDLVREGFRFKEKQKEKKEKKLLEHAKAKRRRRRGGNADGDEDDTYQTPLLQPPRHNGDNDNSDVDDDDFGEDDEDGGHEDEEEEEEEELQCVNPLEQGGNGGGDSDDEDEAEDYGE